MSRYATAESLRSLIRGSYEESIARIREAVAASTHIRTLTEGGVDVGIVATYPDRVVVLTSDKRYMEASIQLAPSGAVVVGEFSPTDGPALYESREALRRGRAQEKVRSVMGG